MSASFFAACTLIWRALRICRAASGSKMASVVANTAETPGPMVSAARLFTATPPEGSG